MKAPDFSYDRPETLAAALAALSTGGPDARLLAGGQSLMPMLNFRVAAPSVLIDINRVPGLDAVEETDNLIRIGALVRHEAVERSETIARHVPMLDTVMPHIAHAAIRSRGTIGGSLAHAAPAAELPACMIALDATIVAHSQNGERRIAAADFFIGIYETALAADEMIVAVEIPKQTARRHAFRELTRRQGDYAIVGLALTAASGPSLDDTRIVFFGVAGQPVRAIAAEAAMAGLEAGAQAGERAAAALDDTLEPDGDLNAPPAMKLHLAKVLLKRAITDLAEGADR
jgi:aerobic carbon-monoxide dehydrogenase medium subunit